MNVLFWVFYILNARVVWVSYILNACVLHFGNCTCPAPLCMLFVYLFSLFVYLLACLLACSCVSMGRICLFHEHQPVKRVL